MERAKKPMKIIKFLRYFKGKNHWFLPSRSTNLPFGAWAAPAYSPKRHKKIEWFYGIINRKIILNVYGISGKNHSILIIPFTCILLGTRLVAGQRPIIKEIKKDFIFHVIHIQSGFTFLSYRPLGVI